MSEKAFKKKLKSSFESYADGDPFHWQLVEDYLSVGLPDISFGIQGVNGWIEAKYTPKNMQLGAIYDPKLEPYQEAWLVARGLAGGYTYLAHGFKDKTLVLTYAALLKRKPGMTIEEVAIPYKADILDNNSNHIAFYILEMGHSLAHKISF